MSEAIEKINKVRMGKLAKLTRGLELSDKQTTSAKLSYYSARENFVRQAIALNYSDTEICKSLDITGHKLQKIKAKVYENEIQTLLRMSQMEHFIEYKLKTMETTKDLDVLLLI